MKERCVAQGDPEWRAQQQVLYIITSYVIIITYVAKVLAMLVCCVLYVSFFLDCLISLSVCEETTYVNMTSWEKGRIKEGERIKKGNRRGWVRWVPTRTKQLTRSDN